MLSYNKDDLLYGTFLALFGLLGWELFIVQNYCGQEKRQVPPLAFGWEGLPEAFRKFSRSSKIRVFRPHSPFSYLPYSPLCPQWIFAHKTVFPTKKFKGASQKGKN